MMFKALISLVLVLVLSPPLAAVAQIEDDPDGLWEAIKRAVETGDHDAYAAVFHPRYVGVFQGSKLTIPVEEELARTQDGFRRTREGLQQVTLDVRFTQRLHDETTAHETGIFRYALRTNDQETVTLLHLEALLVKEADGWLFLMLQQKEAASEAEWAAAEQPYRGPQSRPEG